MTGVQHFEFRAMASACEIWVGISRDQSPVWAAECATRAIAEVQRIEAKYSRYLTGSVIGQINAAAGCQPVTLDQETRSLLAFAQRMYEQSEGLFDITSGVYRQVWDFKKSICPSEEQLSEIRPLVGWSQVQLQDETIFLPRAGMQIDLGGLGKEYAADRAVAVLRELGVGHALVNLGGDIASIGTKPDGQTWSAGVRHPREVSQCMATLDLAGQALATSGDYERYFEMAGQRFCHIIDPRTGWPVQHFRSVSVVAPTCLLAGAVSTTIMLKQADATAQWIQQLALPVLWMDFTGQIGMQSVR